MASGAPTQAQRPWRASGFQLDTGEGKCSLWLKYDANGRLEDRMFRKVVTVSDAQWTSRAFWFGDMDDHANRLPNELACHTIANSPLHEGVLRLRKTAPNPSLLDEEKKRYRVYTRWCPHGSLGTIVERYHKRGKEVPESFIWCVAENLALAGDEISHTNKGCIVHRDLKPDNIFLDYPQQWHYPQYPQPLLGDFGHATLASDVYETIYEGNPEWYQGQGTNGFRAPEQRRTTDTDPSAASDRWALSEKTNVFGVGLVLWCLIQPFEKPDEPSWAQGNLDPVLRIRSGHKSYSPELIGLINWCLRFNPDARPNFRELRDWIQPAICERPPTLNRAAYMRSGTADANTRQAQSIQVGADRYQLGFTQSEVIQAEQAPDPVDEEEDDDDDEDGNGDEEDDDEE